MSIRIKGALEHNLKGFDIEFGPGLTVVTGVSGSGKTSLVFDTLYHEAHRRFLDIFALGGSGLRLSPAKVETVTGLSPAIAVGQNLLNRNPLSTLATAAGLHPFLRLLYARYGERYCRRCGTSITVLTEDEIAHRLLDMAHKDPITVFVPLVRSTRGSHQTLLQMLAAEFGPDALVVDGRIWEPHRLDPAEPHDIEVKIAHLEQSTRAGTARQTIHVAGSLGAHALTIKSSDEQHTLSTAPVCTMCGTWFGDLEPVFFHTPCFHCNGEACAHCDETGLHPEAAAVRWNGLRLPDLLSRSVSDLCSLFADAELPSSASRLGSEIKRRLDCLEQVGLGYVSLDRPAPSLSRGEAQRVRLAVALTSPLEDVVHVLDEPTIGQHPRDVARLLPTFRELPGPVIYVEHDRVAAAVADFAMDLGPGAGSKGGHLLFSGTPAGLWKKETLTGRYFSLKDRVALPTQREKPDRFLVVRGAHLRNLKSIDIPIPLGRLTVISGVSGSGKSTLVEDVLVASLMEGRPVGCRGIEGPSAKPVLIDQSPIGRNPRSNPATYTKLSDIIRDHFASATGLSPSHFSFNRPEGACPACKGMGATEVHMRYLPSTWIRCQECRGQRFSEKVRSAKVAFSSRQLSIAEFYELSVTEARPLLLEKEKLREKARRAAEHILCALQDIGLGYVELGQPSPTLSGGEAQRVKLAKYLGKRKLAGRLLVLDEPSTGLHPHDITGLLVVLDRLVRAGATVVVVEHNSDIIRAADWVVDLGPGAGPEGGHILYSGPVRGLIEAKNSATGQALREEASIRPRAVAAKKQPTRSPAITIRNARAHNLKSLNVEFPKGALTVVTGVSGSGKSNLVDDVLQSEARRRFLESLSLYERQSTREGPEAPVDSVTGLGVTVAIDARRRRFDRRVTVGTVSEISHHLTVLFSWIGRRHCMECGTLMRRENHWHCPSCGATARIADPRHFSPTTYSAACRTCHGVGSLQLPKPEKLIINPEKPLCSGAMYSPGFFPNGYLCKPFNGGYDMVQALATRYDFDPAVTPWNRMTKEARHAFLFGDTSPLEVTFISRTGRTRTARVRFPGFYGWIRDWDVGETYTETRVCPDCKGACLRPLYLAVTLNEHHIHHMSEVPLSELADILNSVSVPETPSIVFTSWRTAQNRLRFLLRVGLGYLHLNRVSATLSAGEAQRVKLTGLLGSGMTALTVLLDEPSRGQHPSEVGSLLTALHELRNEGNTVIVVEHDPVLIRGADHVIDLGPGPGVKGGEIVAQGKPGDIAQSETLTGLWLRHDRRIDTSRPRRKRRGWLTIRAPRANNLRGDDIKIPLGLLVGVCGVSGSGKSTLMVDTLGRALAPRKQTTSVAYEPVDPGRHESIEEAPTRAVVVNQARAGLISPASFLGLDRPLRALYVASEDATALGLNEKHLSRNCSVCKGQGSIKIDMAFLPDVHIPCDTCRGTGYGAEAWEVRVRGLALPELFGLTIDEVHDLWNDGQPFVRAMKAARNVGLGYLMLRQPGYSLSGGEAQRLKIARELSRRTSPETLYILDEPTVGQHMDDVARLIGVLHGLVDKGHTVIVIEHHPHVLVSCDWLLELGPGGGPAGGRLIASGTPKSLAAGNTPTAPFLKEVLGPSQ